MIFQVKGGCFSYQKNPEPDKYLLQDINFSTENGDLIAVLGPNGSGKTTLLRCMMGFLRWHKGQSLINGQDVHDMPYREIWSKLAYVPQAKNTVSAYTAEQMVLLGRSNHIGMFGQPSQTDLEKAQAVMDSLGILGIAKKKCSQISGGELQMVLISRALVSEPELLILDEPESNLDFRNQLIILNTMARLASEGMTCIFNTHYPAHALQRANKSLLLGRHGIYLFGDTKKVISEQNIEEAFGVKTVIGQIETDSNILYDLLPIRLTKSITPAKKPELKKEVSLMEERLAIIAIIAGDRHMADHINNLLGEYGQYIISRMGMPYEKRGVFIISVIMDAPHDIVEALSMKLGSLPDVSVKTTYSKK
jgi:iron complex transport system ATP-binding protein